MACRVQTSHVWSPRTGQNGAADVHGAYPCPLLLVSLEAHLGWSASSNPSAPQKANQRPTSDDAQRSLASLRLSMSLGKRLGGGGAYHAEIIPR
mmetsp:Transcript_42524/g.85292  ORF Transcript_42524/g.85292 Transcript_42524/m.85292 type:complete len:94 (+) Transcript_42524:108-389(+)